MLELWEFISEVPPRDLRSKGRFLGKISFTLRLGERLREAGGLGNASRQTKGMQEAQRKERTHQVALGKGVRGRREERWRDGWIGFINPW